MTRPTALGPVVDFVEGRLDPPAFEALLGSDPALEQALDRDGPGPPAYTGGSLYRYLLAQDYAAPGGVHSAHAALVWFLASAGVAATPTDRYARLFDLLLSAQPRWLDLSDAFLRREILPAAGERAGPALKAWLRAELLKRFRCAGRPPRWVQGPRWPIGPNGPLVFLGQLPVRDYFHDAAVAYVFHDPVSGACETVVQIH